MLSLPRDLVNHISSFFIEKKGSLSESYDDRNLIHLFQTNKKLKEKYKDELTKSCDRLRFNLNAARITDQFPIKIVELFRKYNISIGKLPEIDLQGRTGESGYIDFLSEDDLIAPIIRFKDVVGRLGVSFLIQEKVDDIEDEEKEMSIKKEAVVLTIFQRYENCDYSWKVGEYCAKRSIERKLKQKFKDEKLYKFLNGIDGGDDVNLEIIELFLSGDYPCFEIKRM